MIFDTKTEQVLSFTGSDKIMAGIGKPWEPLSILVDGSGVVAAMIISFEEGILAYWPPEIDDETVFLAENLFFPKRHGMYVILGGNGFKYKYLGIMFGEKILLLALNKKVEAERLAEKLVGIILRHVEKIMV
ncbi:MAG: hypothetical protein GXO43_03070 [Crenarchaeota archaeon]|nr:hypothetical protein [Thermoproteota archaeon]